MVDNTYGCVAAAFQKSPFWDRDKDRGDPIFWQFCLLLNLAAEGVEEGNNIGSTVFYKLSSHFILPSLYLYTLSCRWVLLIVRCSTTIIPFSAFSDYVTYSSRIEMPGLVVGLSL